jgi:hypothetical protein
VFSPPPLNDVLPFTKWALVVALVLALVAAGLALFGTVWRSAYALIPNLLMQVRFFCLFWNFNLYLI